MSDTDTKMTKGVCFICNKESEDLQKMNEVTSKHTNTPISTILKEILGHFHTKRTIDNDTNCICSDCINKIEEYDWACDIAKKQEKIISEIFLETETLYTKASGDGESTENVCKKIDSSVCLLPGVKAGRSDSFEFRSITIRKITKDTKQIKSEFREDVKIEEYNGSENDQEQEQEQEDEQEQEEEQELEDDQDDDYENVDTDSGSDYEYTPYRASKSSKSNQSSRPTTSHSRQTRKRRKMNPSSDDNNEPTLNEYGLPTPKSKHDCLHCEQKFAKKIELIYHERWHKKQLKPKFSCDLCSYVLDDQESFDTHRKLHETVGKFECVICNKVLSTRGNLTIHMRVHGTPNFICHICGKEFIHSTSFDAHMKCHNNSRQYACKECPMKFNIATNLKNHMQTHRDYKPYACSICGSRFGYLGNMKAHEKTHSTIEQSHTCTVCDAKFATQKNLLQHMNKHHSASTLHKKEVKPRLRLQCFQSAAHNSDINE